MRSDFHGTTDESFAEAVLHAGVELGVVVEFGKHGDGVLGVRVFRIAGVELVEGHEIDFAWQSTLIDFLQENGADFVRFHQMEEETRTGGDFDGREKGAIHFKVLDQEPVIALDHVFVAILIAE